MFKPESLQFLRDLEENNDRDWFLPRKEKFETLLKQPMLDAVATLNRALAQSAPDYITDPAKSVYRVYRDTRFSKNKAPYKTHLGALLWHRRLGKDGGAALYFHISAKEFLIAGGLYKSEPAALLAVRQHISAEHAKLRSILKKEKLEGEKLARPPKGFHADNPAIDLIMHKDYLLESSLPAETATGPEAADMLTTRMIALIPFVEFLNAPLLLKRKRSAITP